MVGPLHMYSVIRRNNGVVDVHAPRVCCLPSGAHDAIALTLTLFPPPPPPPNKKTTPKVLVQMLAMVSPYIHCKQLFSEVTVSAILQGSTDESTPGSNCQVIGTKNNRSTHRSEGLCVNLAGIRKLRTIEWTPSKV